VHILGHKQTLGQMRMVGLGKKLRSIRPDIVQTTKAIGWIPLDAAVYMLFLGYKLFTGCHITASVFPLANRKLPWWSGERLQCVFLRFIPGHLISFFSQKCYAVTEDCARIASRCFGVQSQKVDTDHFYPALSEVAVRERCLLRQQLGFKEDDIVCIYTGKFTEEKNVTALAEAVEQLRSRQEAFRGLFIGNGPQRKALEGFPSSVVLGFMPYFKLAQYYRAADIGVWPGNESTSMLDGAACGLPVVISDRVAYRAPVDGNGRVFKNNAPEDLLRVLHELRETQTRKSLSSSGAARMACDFSWESLAKRRLRDYQIALGSEKWLDTENPEGHPSKAARSQT
jgi:glycosyltransferase involved in cell wall biosynthesis